MAGAPESAERSADRLDRWLWQARFFRTRSLAARIVAANGVRVNGQKTVKPAAAVGPGDVLTFAQGRDIRVVRILALATRRGPAQEARALYEDMDLPRDEKTPPRTRVGPRPTKKARRNLGGPRDDPD